MKVIGLVGGMSWESTASYYRIINEEVKRRLGGLHSARIVLHSVDFHEVEQFLRAERWDELGRLLGNAAASMERAGADFLVLCTNTMHKGAPAIERAVSIPLLHIADATAAAVRNVRINVVGLMGTRPTMEQEFYVGRLRERHGLTVLVPDDGDREDVHRVVFDELCRGRILDRSRDAYHQVIDRLVSRGAKGIILGCTEMSMLVDPERLDIPTFDTTRLHAIQAAHRAIGDEACDSTAG